MLFEQKVNTKRPYFIIDKIYGWVILNDDSQINPEYELLGDLWYDKFDFNSEYKMRTEFIRIKNVGEGLALGVKYDDSHSYFNHSQGDDKNTLKSDETYDIIVMYNQDNPRFVSDISYYSIAGIKFTQKISVSFGSNSIEIKELSLQEIVQN